MAGSAGRIQARRRARPDGLGVRSTIRAERIGLALVAGGALGNAQDRWRQGAVTDFIDLHWGWLALADLQRRRHRHLGRRRADAAAALADYRVAEAAGVWRRRRPLRLSRGERT